jgi:hypothetical protein
MTTDGELDVVSPVVAAIAAFGGTISAAAHMVAPIALESLLRLVIECSSETWVKE